MRNRSFLVWAGVAVLLSCASVQGKEKWIHARTENFDMYSSASESTSRRFLNKLEQFRTAFGKVFIKPSTGEARMTVIMFGDSKEFEPFCPLYKGKPKLVGGFYSKWPDHDWIVLSAASAERAEDDGSNVIFHEYVHKLLHEGGLKPPTWLDEGLAQFYATMTVSSDKVEVGAPSARGMRAMSRSAMLDLDRLFAVTHKSPEYNEQQMMGVFYAQSWLLVHYLLCGVDKSVEGKFVKYIDAVEQDHGPNEARFKEIFGMDYERMGIALRSYMDLGRYKMRTYRLPIGDFSAQIEFCAASGPERDTVLEDLRWRVRRDDANAARLLQLSDEEPKLALTCEALAAFSMGKERDERMARSYWQKAAERGSDNAYVYLQLARFDLRELIRGSTLEFRAPDQVVEPLRKHLDRAIELRPGYPEAWESLAMLEALSEHPRAEAIRRVQQKLPELSSRGNTLAALAVIRWRMKDYETCRLIVANMKGHSLSSASKSLVRQLEKKLAALDTQQSPAPQAAVAPQ